MKAILVIDMPKNCSECDLIDNITGNCLVGIVDGYDYKTIRKGCPLKPMPYRYVEDKVRIETSRDAEVCTHGVQIGRNMVINEILGETNDRDI